MRYVDRVTYCYNDKDGLVMEFSTLTEAVKSAREYSRDNPDCEVNIYAVSSIFFRNGKLEF